MISYHLFQIAGIKTNAFFRLRKKQIHSYSPCALIRHSKLGNILFNTGFPETLAHLNNKWPNYLYKPFALIAENNSISDALKTIGLAPKDIHYIILSHFHTSAIGGLQDFPNAYFICHQEAYQAIKNKNGLRAIMKGFIPALLPTDFNQRLLLLDSKKQSYLPTQLSPFKSGIDIFDDESLFAIDLPGFAKGQIGLYFKTEKALFLTANSCRNHDAYRQCLLPSTLIRLFYDNKKLYLQTLKKLHLLYKKNRDIYIVTP